jgi:hypothetical protein
MCVRKFEENENKKKVNKQSLLRDLWFGRKKKRERFSELRIKVPISFVP